MSSDDLDNKLALLSAQTKGRTEALQQQHENRTQQILLQNQLKNAVPTDSDPEIIKLRHQLGIETRQLDREDAVFYGNMDLQDFIKRQQVTQSHLLEEIQHTTVSTILEKAILMILSSKLESKSGKEAHEQGKDKKTHDTTQQMRFEEFRAELTVKFGEAKAEEVLAILERNIGEWEKKRISKMQNF